MSSSWIRFRPAASGVRPRATAASVGAAPCRAGPPENRLARGCERKLSGRARTAACRRRRSRAAARARAGFRRRRPAPGPRCSVPYRAALPGPGRSGGHLSAGPDHDAGPWRLYCRAVGRRRAGPWGQTVVRGPCRAFGAGVRCSIRRAGRRRAPWKPTRCPPVHEVERDDTAGTPPTRPARGRALPRAGPVASACDAPAYGVLPLPGPAAGRRRGRRGHGKRRATARRGDHGKRAGRRPIGTTWPETVVAAVRARPVPRLHRPARFPGRPGRWPFSAPEEA